MTAATSNRFLTASLALALTQPNGTKREFKKVSYFYDVPDSAEVVEKKFTLQPGGTKSVSLPSNNKVLCVEADEPLSATVEFPGSPNVTVVMPVKGVLFLSAPVVSLALTNPSVVGAKLAQISVTAF